MKTHAVVHVRKSKDNLQKLVLSSTLYNEYFYLLSYLAGLGNLLVSNSCYYS